MRDIDRINLKIRIGPRLSPTLFAMVFASSLATAGLPIETVLMSDAQAPGTDPGVTFFGEIGVNSFDRFLASINDLGQVAVRGRLVGPGIEAGVNDLGFWLGGGGQSAKLVVRAGQQAPGLAGGFEFSTAAFRNSDFGLGLNDVGQMVLTGQAFDNSATDPAATRTEGVWIAQPGEPLSLFVKTGDPAASPVFGATFSQFVEGNPSVLPEQMISTPVVNNAGQFVVQALISGSGLTDDSNTYGVWRGSFAGDLDRIAGGGVKAPGTDEYFYGGHEPHEMFIDDAGRMLIKASTTINGIEYLRTPGTPLTNGLWYGDSAESLEQHFYIDNPPSPLPSALNAVVGIANGTSASGSYYVNHFDCHPSSCAFDPKIYRHDPGVGRTEIMAPGAHAPGQPAAVTIGRLGGARTLADESLLIGLTLQGPGIEEGIEDHINSPGGNDSILYRFPRNGPAEMLLREGEPVPGHAGMEFSEPSFAGIRPNEQGQFALEIELFAPDPASGGGTLIDSLWGYDPVAGLQEIITAGDTIEITPGDLRTVIEVRTLRSPTNGIDGRASAINYFGEIAFTAFFDDGTSGVFVSRIETIPEPSGFLLMLAGGMLAACGRWRSKEMIA